MKHLIIIKLLLLLTSTPLFANEQHTLKITSPAGSLLFLGGITLSTAGSRFGIDNSKKGFLMIGAGALLTTFAQKAPKKISERGYYKEFRLLRAQLRTSVKLNKVINDKKIINLVENFETSVENDNYLRKIKIISELVKKLDKMAKDDIHLLTATNMSKAYPVVKYQISSEHLRSEILELLGENQFDYNIDFAYKVYLITYYDAFIKRY